MNNTWLSKIGIKILPVILLALIQSAFIIQQTDQVLVLRLGKVQRILQDPGLYWKIPLLDEVVTFDKRVLNYSLPAQEIIAGDQERVVVDTFAFYKITDPLKYFQALQNEAGANRRLITLIQGSLRSVLGNYHLSALLSEERVSVMKKIQNEVGDALSGFGLKIIDVRIRKADLPLENSKAIFRRMATQREVMAKELRSVGEEISLKIKSNADRERTIIISNAQKEAERIKGEGDSIAFRIYSKAFGRDKEFFEFYKSLQAYKNALNGNKNKLLLSPKSEFFKYFGQSN